VRERGGDPFAEGALQGREFFDGIADRLVEGGFEDACFVVAEADAVALGDFQQDVAQQLVFVDDFDGLVIRRACAFAAVPGGRARIAGRVFTVEAGAQRFRDVPVEQGQGIQQHRMADFIRALDQAADTFFPFGKNFIADRQHFPGLFG
jgi:hypothetical protein